MRRLLIPALVFTALSVTACGSTEVIQPSVNVSIGQQLIDLKKAHDAGAMDQREYERQREMLVDSVRR